MLERSHLTNALSRVFIQRDLQTSRYSNVAIADFVEPRSAKPRNSRNG